MRITEKLKGIPTIYYFNLDCRVDRKEYMESQFYFWEINYKRISNSKYTPKNYDEWKEKIILNPKCNNYFRDTFSDDYGEVKHQRYLSDAATTMTQIETVKNWLEETSEKYMIIMEDDYDLSMIEYMHFDWEYLMNNIPYDWDVIQFDVSNRLGIPCFLHPTMDRSATGPLLINREYAKKLIRIHYTSDNKLNLNQRIASYNWTINSDDPSLTADYIMSKNGKSYSLPLMYQNPDLGSYENHMVRKRHHGGYLKHIKELYHKWWKILRDDYTLEEFFTHGKPNDLILKVNPKFSCDESE